MELRIAQGFSYQGNDWWKWWVWIEGPDEELAQVREVVYQLHPTFPNPVRVIKDRDSRFKLEAVGWGVFRIFAKPLMQDGSSHRLHHDLRLQYPDGCELASKNDQVGRVICK